MNRQFNINTSHFSGPMDLLVFLVQRQEVDLYQISITRLVRDYFEYLEQLRELNIEVAAEFVSMSAYLLLLKSKAMLPRDAVGDDEEIDIENPQWELIKQLIEYKKFKDSSAFLMEREGLYHGLFAAQPHHYYPEEVEGELPKELDSFRLAAAFQEVLIKLEEKHAEGLIKDEEFTVAGKIQDLKQKLVVGQRVRLKSLIENLESKHELITVFLAMLEMAKVNLLGIFQSSDERFAEIEIALLAPVSDDAFELSHE